VSRQHAEVEYQNGEFRLRDKESKQGTMFLNQHPVALDDYKSNEITFLIRDKLVNIKVFMQNKVIRSLRCCKKNKYIIGTQWASLENLLPCAIKEVLMTKETENTKILVHNDKSAERLDMSKSQPCNPEMEKLYEELNQTYNHQDSFEIDVTKQVTQVRKVRQIDSIETDQGLNKRLSSNGKYLTLTPGINKQLVSHDNLFLDMQANSGRISNPKLTQKQTWKFEEEVKNQRYIKRIKPNNKMKVGLKQRTEGESKKRINLVRRY